MIQMPAQAAPPPPLAPGYHSAPAPLDQLLDAPFLPALSLSPDHQHFLLLQHRTLPDISELAEPELRLAGLRINPQNFAPSRSWYYTGLHISTLQQPQTTLEVKGLPEKPRISNIRWSHDGKFLAFTHTQAKGVEMWLLDIKTQKARRLGDYYLNKSYGQPFLWHPDGKTLIVKVRHHEKPPEQNGPEITGPTIMESEGKARPGRTYQDLLKSPADEARFSYYLRSRLWRIDLSGKRLNILSKANLHMGFQVSPNGEYLLRKTLHEPFSYMFPAFRFPQRIEVVDMQGKKIKTIAELPLANEIPLSFDAVRPGPRRVSWQQNAPATLYWTEALDQGKPSIDAKYRDELKAWQAPFKAKPKSLLKVEDRIDVVYWGQKGLGLVYTEWYQNRQKSIWKINAEASAKSEATRLAKFSSENRYELPGYPLLEHDEEGNSLLLQEGEHIFLQGQGASPEGERPFIDQWSLDNNQKKRLWRSQAPYFEKPIRYIAEHNTLITRRESREETPNYYLKALRSEATNSSQEQSELAPKALTNFPDPFPEIQGAHKEIIHYQRADGVQLSAKLYTPPGWKAGDPPLPTVIWAYPREFKSVKAAGQVKGSPYSYVRASLWSPLVFLTQGYAVVHEPAMPIIGVGQQEPNDSYVQQLTANAEALVQKISEMGVSDPKKLAVGGHSYGAFMAANLLVHTDLFQAGIARSGAYNRTLTPFGFQSEQRNYWAAEEVYQKMSPFMQADKIKEPLLLIHGADDPNSGTYPMQSRYFYQALKGLGAPVRLVMLPHEGHSYRSRDSLSHVLWEMTRWLDIHLKGATPDGEN